MWNQGNQGFVPIPGLPQQQQNSNYQPPNQPGYPPQQTSPGYPQLPQQYTGSPYPPQPGAPPAQTSAPGYPPLNNTTYPPAPGYPPVGGSPYPPPVGFQPSGQQYPPPGQPYPSAGQQYPPPGQAYPSAGQQYPSAGQQYPSTGQQYPPAGQPFGYPPQPTNQAPGYPQYPPASGGNPLTFVAGPGLPPPDPLFGSGVLHGPRPPYQTQAPTQFNFSPFVSNREPELDNANNRFYSPDPSQPTTGYPPPVRPENTFNTQLTYPGKTGPENIHMATNMQPHEEIPTIRPSNADPLADAQILRKAMKGFGTDEAAIINVLTKRTNAERLNILRAYKQSFGKDLIKDLKSELSGRLEEVVLALMTPRDEYIAQAVRNAMSGIGTREKILIDVLCSSTNSEILAINAAYTRLFKTTIEKDLAGDTSGHFRRLLVSMNTGGRSEGTAADPAMAAQDANALLQAGVKKWGTDESAFNAVLATRSWPQLRLMFHEYEKIAGQTFEKAIQGEFSGDIERGMLAIVKCAKNRAQYFAERLHNSMAGLGTKDDDLIFLIVTRADVDLESIKQEYHRLYNKSLAATVSGDTSGDYKKVLLGLVG